MFDGKYLTYSEYRSLGGTLEETPFNLLEYESRKQIDLRTHNRLVGIDEIPNEIKLCDFHLINKIKDYATTLNTISQSNKASENIDGYSVSFISPSQITEIILSKSNELDDIMRTDLYGVIVNNEHIIYNGVK